MATVDIYLVSRETIVRMSREMTFERVPVNGEFIRIDAGGLLPHMVTEVVHDVDGSARVVLGFRKNAVGNYDFWETEDDLEDDVMDLEGEGWSLASRVPNRTHKIS